MLNHLCAKMTDVAFDLLLKGVHPLRQCSLALICQFALNIASSMKRHEYIARMRDSLFFERTRLSWKQILYIDFCNKVMPGLGVKFFKQQLLPDLMKHCQKLTFVGKMAITAGTSTLVETKHAQITPTESMNVIWLRTGVLRCRVGTLTNEAIVLTPYVEAVQKETRAFL